MAAAAGGGRRRRPRIHLIGEGWNFGEVADGARFVQASQRSLNGSGIAPSATARATPCAAAARGDDGIDQRRRQGWLNGLFYDPNEAAAGAPRATTCCAGRPGARGPGRHPARLPMQTPRRRMRRWSRSPTAGSPPATWRAGRGGELRREPRQPDAVRRQRLQAAASTPRARTARGCRCWPLAINAFSQGIAYFHAGIETLRSKSMDRNSYDSGDWFNRLDWTFQDNFFGSGLPPAGTTRAAGRS
jgi:pullulanase